MVILNILSMSVGSVMIYREVQFKPLIYFLTFCTFSFIFTMLRMVISRFAHPLRLNSGGRRVRRPKLEEMKARCSLGIQAQ